MAFLEFEKKKLAIGSLDVNISLQVNEYHLMPSKFFFKQNLQLYKNALGNISSHII